MIADACNFACDEIYDVQEGKWVENGTREPTMYIATEQELEEIQPMMIAFLSGVDSDRVVNINKLNSDELERVAHAVKLLKRSPLYLKTLPDFSLQDIEDTIRYRNS